MISGTIKTSLFAILFALSFFNAAAQAPKLALKAEPWTEKQLMAPATLAQLIEEKKKVQVYNIGVVQNIKGATNIGGASDAENLNKLKQSLKSKDKKEAIVLYCGCCPMDRCPNIRPAFKLLMDQKFSNVHLLNLPVNIKANWIDKGYPID